MKVKKYSQPHYLPIAEWRISELLSFPRVRALCEMQTVSSKTWTRVAVSISYGGIHYAMITFFLSPSLSLSLYIYIYIYMYEM